jgi:tight adherence protein C
MTALIIAGLVIAVLVVLIMVAYSSLSKREQEEDDPLTRRLAEITQAGETITSLEDVELSQPFAERVIFPIIKRIGEASARFTPQHQLETVTKQLALAGNPGRLDASTFLALRFVLAGVLGGVILLLSLVGKWPFSRQVLFVGGAAVMGYILPQRYLSSTIQKRQKNIRKAMPDALDLLTICVEAGLGLDAAMSKVAEKWDNELSQAFGRAIREIQLGKARREALRDMAERIGIPEMTSFVAALIQTETLGVSMAKVLRIQSEQMRLKRRQRAEEEAHKAPTKMLMPLVGLIFPTLFIILLTPAALRLMKVRLFG